MEVRFFLDASKPSVANAKVGSACVARYVEDDAWYRGHILSIDGGQAKVFFVDYGNTQVPTPGQILSDISAFSCCLRSRFTSNGNR